MKPAGCIQADGYTLLVGGSVLWLAPFLQDSVAYDPVKDFSPLSFTARSVNILVVHPSVAANSVRELIALATPAELATAMASEMTRMGKLVRDARLRSQ